MSGPRGITELSEVSSIQDEDLIVVEQVSNNSSTTMKSTFSTLKDQLIKGPFANDTEALAGSVGVGHLYYNSVGEVRVRLV